MIATALKHMLAAGMPHEEIVAAVAEMESNIASAERQVSGSALRMRRLRERHKASQVTSPVTSDAEVTVCDGNARLTCAEPEPNKTTYPTTSEANASSVEPQPAQAGLTGDILPPIAKPKPPPSPSRGCRIPPGFPGDDEREWCRLNLRMTDDDFDECAAEFRDYWSGVPGQRGVKCDWPATFRNGARKYRPHGRSRQAYASGNQRPDGSLLGAYQRGAARVRQANDVSRERAGVFDHRERELEMHYRIPAE